MGDQHSDSVPRREWVKCFLSCVFDLDAGQTVEACYPEGVLTLGESKGIAYGAFPVCTARRAVYPFAHFKSPSTTQLVAL